MQPQAQQIQIPFQTIAGFVLNMQCLIAIDLSCYVPGVEGREVVLHLAGPHEHTLENERADQAYVWFMQISGQARVVPVSGPVAVPGPSSGQ